MSPLSLFMIFLKLGLTSFGGPVAHLGYFRTEFVTSREWFSEKDYADLVALCQFLPGPASSQVGFAVGYKKGGMLGALAAFLGFTLPSAVLLVAFGYGISFMDGGLNAGILAGLKVVAVAVVAQAVLGMGRGLVKDGITFFIATTATLFLIFYGVLFAQFGVILIGGIIGYFFCRPALAGKGETVKQPEHKKPLLKALLYGGAFGLILVLLPVIAAESDTGGIMLFDSFYRSGALVFGGGHVVLPLLEAETVATGWVDRDLFLAGYGATQAMPGPLFTFAGFLGSVVTATGLPTGLPTGLVGATIALAAVFLPGFLLVLAFLPSWDRLRATVWAQKALMGVNAAVVGLLAAALWNPVITQGIAGVEHALLALAAYAALDYMKAPPWLVVIGSALAGWIVLS